MDWVCVRSPQTSMARAESRAEAQAALRVVVSKLRPHSAASDFPRRCLDVARSEVAPILDSAVNSRDTLLIRAEVGDGRTLGLILLLAAACAQDGLAALISERAEFDSTRAVRTRNWLSYTRRVRKQSPSLRKFSVARWSSIRRMIAEPEQGTDPVTEQNAEQDSDLESLSFIRHKPHDLRIIQTK